MPTTQRKTEVLSIKTTPRLKHALRVIAELETRSIANTLEYLIVSYFKTRRLPLPQVDAKPVSDTSPINKE